MTQLSAAGFMSKFAQLRRFRCQPIVDRKADYMEAEGHHLFSHVFPAGLGDVNPSPVGIP